MAKEHTIAIYRNIERAAVVIHVYLMTFRRRTCLRVTLVPIFNNIDPGACKIERTSFLRPKYMCKLAMESPNVEQESEWTYCKAEAPRAQSAGGKVVNARRVRLGMVRTPVRRCMPCLVPRFRLLAIDC